MTIPTPEREKAPMPLPTEKAEAKTPRVLNKKIDALPPDAVYVGHPSIYGNPFKMTTEARRDHVCDLYEQWAPQQPWFSKALIDLRGKDLVCWCAPKRCHADTLLKWANKP